MGIPTLDFPSADTGVSYKRMFFDFTDFCSFLLLHQDCPFPLAR